MPTPATLRPQITCDLGIEPSVHTTREVKACIMPPTLFSLRLRHMHWQTLCRTTQQQLTASPETYTSGTHGTAGVNCKPSSPTNSNFLSILASPFVCCCSFVFEVGAGLCSHACAFKNAAPPSRKNGNNTENPKKLCKSRNNQLFHNFQRNFENQCGFSERWLGRATLSVVFFLSPLALGASARKLRTDKMEATRKTQKFCSK